MAILDLYDVCINVMKYIDLSGFYFDELVKNKDFSLQFLN